MRILYTNFHGGDGGGHTTYILALARVLATRHEVHVAAPPGSRLLREAGAIAGVTAMAQPFPNGLGQWPRRAAALRALRAHLRAHAFDVVHVNGSADHRLVLAALRGLRSRPRVVLTKHNSKSMRSIGHALRARRTDLVIAVCEWTARQVRASSYRRCRTATVHNGIDLARFAPWPAADAARERARWVAGGDVLLVGSNAGTARYKGWMDLVEAIALLPPATRARVHALVAGAPPGEQERARIDALGLAAQVHFPGMLDDVRPAIAAFDVGFVLSWGVETISFACREMMAMGKPVLVSDYAGLPENITPGRDGWIVPVRDPPAVARTLGQILDARDAVPTMGTAAAARARAQFGLDAFVDATEAAYRALRTGTRVDD